MSNKENWVINHPMYTRWNNMKQRCSNPNQQNYSRYGGRGIKVCERWSKRGGFLNYIKDMGMPPAEGMTIDRIDNDGDYTPENCRWATKSMQSYNQERTIKPNTGFWGVYKIKSTYSRKKQYRVDLILDKTSYFIGHYNDIEEAKLNHDIAAIQLRGDEARLNIL